VAADPDFPDDLDPAPSTRRGRAGVPHAEVTIALRAHVAADELARTAFRRLRQPPEENEFRRISEEANRAAGLYDQKGWLTDPSAYHPDPPPLHEPQLRPSRAAGMAVDRLKFPSAWTPPAGVPGRKRWLQYQANAVGRATVLRHLDRPRHWVVCIHGTGMGRDADLRSFRARRLFIEFGCNVVLPILPLHGPRRPPRGSGVQFPTLDVLDNAHGLAQAAWDVRRILSWIRSQEPLGVGVMGVSLGGYVAALVAGLEPEPLQCALPIIPATDFPALFLQQSPPELRERMAPFLDASTLVHSVVSPLKFDPITPHSARAIAGGLADKLIDPVDQVAPLWEHWGRPRILWFPGGHVGHLVRRDLHTFVDETLESTGLTAG